MKKWIVAGFGVLSFVCGVIVAHSVEALHFSKHHFRGLDHRRHLAPTFSFISSTLRFVITLSTRFFPTRTTTCAITPPNWISTTFPSNRFRAESVMPQSIRLPDRSVYPCDSVSQTA